MKKRIIVLQVDLYTKVILTIIALALGGILIKLFLTPSLAGAQGSSTQPVNNRGAIIDVNIAQINGREPDIAKPIRVSVTRAQTIPVSVTNTEAIGVKVEDPLIMPVSLVEPERLLVEVAAPKPLPVVETWHKYYIQPKE